MPINPRPADRSRSAAEARYRELRRVAFHAAEVALAAAGISVELRATDAAALAAVAKWDGRRVAWDWPEMAARWSRLFGALGSDDQLLDLGRGPVVGRRRPAPHDDAGSRIF